MLRVKKYKLRNKKLWKTKKVRTCSNKTLNVTKTINLKNDKMLFIVQLTIKRSRGGVGDDAVIGTEEDPCLILEGENLEKVHRHTITVIDDTPVQQINENVIDYIKNVLTTKPACKIECRISAVQRCVGWKQYRGLSFLFSLAEKVTKITIAENNYCNRKSAGTMFCS